MLFPLRSSFDTWSRTSASVTESYSVRVCHLGGSAKDHFFLFLSLCDSSSQPRFQYIVFGMRLWGLHFFKVTRNEPPGDEIFHKPVEEDSLPYFSGAPSSRRFAPWRDCLCTLIPGDHRFFLIFSCLDPVPLGEVAVQNVWRCDLTLLDKVLVGSLMLGEVLVIVRTFWTTLAHALETCCSHKQAF